MFHKECCQRTRTGWGLCWPAPCLGCRRWFVLGPLLRLPWWSVNCEATPQPQTPKAGHLAKKYAQALKLELCPAPRPAAEPWSWLPRAGRAAGVS